MHARSRTSLLLVGVAALPLYARAEWPMSRHDPRRTATASNASRLERPVRVWSRYLGGRVRADALVDADVDANGQRDLVIVSGGRLLVKRPDDTTVWETPPYGFDRIAAVEDLNGDRELDVVVVGYPAVVAVFGGRDGRLEWRTASDTFGPSLGAVRLADFNGDGMRDLYVAESNCGSVGQRGDVAWAYTFGRGFGAGVEDTATRLWQLERGRDYVCGVNDVLADMNNDRRPDVLAFSSGHAWLFDGTTGRKIPSGNAAAPALDGYPLGFSVPYGVLATDAVDVNGDGRVEVVGYTNNSYAPSINSRAVFVLDYDPARPQATRLAVRWRASVPTLTTDQHRYVDAGAVDLDRDGRHEVVSTFDVLGAGPTTTVYRATDGAVLARIPGATVTGVLDTGPGLPVTLLVRRGVNLEGYRFPSLATAPADGGITATEPAFTIPNVEPVRFNSLARRQRGSAQTEVVTVPETDGTHRALVVRVNESNRIQAWAVREAMPTRQAEYDPGASAPSLVQPERDVSSPGEGVLLARSDGVLLVLDRTFRPLNLGSVEIPLPGVRFGGYYSGGCGSLTAPVAARMEGRGDSIFAVDSQQSLLRIDAVGASRVRPPTVAWRWDGAAYPSVLDVDGDGARDVVAVTDTRRAGEFRTLNARRSNGTTTVWSQGVPMRTTEQVSGDVVPLAGAADGVRLAVQTIDGSNGEGRVYAFSNRGDRVFATTPIVTAGSGQGQLAAFDVDGDRRDDPLLYLAAVLYAYSGNGGSILASGLSSYPTMPVVVSGGAGPVDVVTTGAYGPIDGISFPEQMGMTPPRRINTHWSTPSTYPSGSFAACYGAVVRCADGLRVANAFSTSPRLVVLEAATGNVVFDVALASGRTFANEMELRAAVPSPGLLGNVTASPSIDGMNAAFVVGSSDGHLYALDACAARPTLRWAMDFRAPVGEAIFADPDGDGVDEIVVTSADGFLHVVDTEETPAPAYVFDTDPPRVTETDVDEVRGLTLSATWAAVPGATAYEWALFTALGTPVSQNPADPSNPFLRTTERSANWGMGLVNGTSYFFAVRALDASGRSSVETLSDGVRYLREGPSADGGADAGVDVAVVDGPAVEDAGADGGAGADVADASDAATGDVAMDATKESPPSGAGTGGCGCAVPGTAMASRVGVVWALAALLALRARRRPGRSRS